MESTAFVPGGTIPPKHTCSGDDLSPALVWAEAPPGTEAYALICDDPDAPAGVWDHWVIYDIPALSIGLGEGVPKDATLPDGTKQGKNGWGSVGYRGPCPPRGGPHRYIFQLLALAKPLGLKAGATSLEVREAAATKTLATAELMGTFGRP